MIVRLSPEAERNLEAIGDFIARDNPRRAVTFVRERRARCLNLVVAPSAYPLVPGHETKGIRRRRYRNYLIFYVVRENVIAIVHILHAAQDYLSIIDRL